MGSWTTNHDIMETRVLIMESGQKASVYIVPSPCRVHRFEDDDLNIPPKKVFLADVINEVVFSSQALLRSLRVGPCAVLTRWRACDHELQDETLCTALQWSCLSRHGHELPRLLQQRFVYNLCQLELWRTDLEHSPHDARECTRHWSLCQAKLDLFDGPKALRCFFFVQPRKPDTLELSDKREETLVLYA